MARRRHGIAIINIPDFFLLTTLSPLGAHQIPWAGEQVICVVFTHSFRGNPLILLLHSGTEKAVTMASSSKPPSFLLYTCIAHRTTILAEHSSPGTSSTSASSLASIILPKITHEKSQKLTYTHERLFVHYIADSPTGASDDSSFRQEPNSYAPLSYIVVATAEQGRRIPFAFLLEMKRKFLSTYPPSSTDFAALPAYGCAAFNNELRSLLQTYNTAPPSDSLASARREIDSVRDIMTENIERVLERGERIDLLVDKTDRLGGSAHDFRIRSRGLRRRMWWKNIKLMVLLGVVIVFLLYLFIGVGCGLPAWGKCVGHSE